MTRLVVLFAALILTCSSLSCGDEDQAPRESGTEIWVSIPNECLPEVGDAVVDAVDCRPCSDPPRVGFPVQQRSASTYLEFDGCRESEEPCTATVSGLALVVDLSGIDGYGGSAPFQTVGRCDP